MQENIPLTIPVPPPSDIKREYLASKVQKYNDLLAPFHGDQKNILTSVRKREIYKRDVATAVLTSPDDEVRTDVIKDRLATQYGALFLEEEFNIAFEIIYDYCRTGGAGNTHTDPPFQKK